LATIGSFSSRF